MSHARAADGDAQAHANDADVDVDVLIVGAGISGVGLACHLERDCPGKRYVILERRPRMGGTWDLFRYPGIRSDSDMFTFGYKFRPWHDTKVLADGPAIREYLQQTAREYGVSDHIRYGTRVVRASWSTPAKRWSVETVDEQTGESEHFSARVFVACTGYYNYDQGYRPHFPGEERFGGQLVHPQFWPEDLDYAGKRVVIIGSGATAVTLVPAMAEDTAHVTMLQRSPSYILSLPAVDKITAQMQRVLPDGVAYKLARARNIGIQRAMYAIARRYPDAVRNFIVKSARKQLAGTASIEDFRPRYDPWDQRLCIVPDGDLFRAIREGKADVVTDRIVTFTESGIELESGGHLEADIVVTATGLEVQMLGGATLEVDGEKVPLNDRLTYKAVLVEGVPNAAVVFGYVNASWTLKADIAAEYLCRVLNRMDEKGYTSFVASAGDDDRSPESVLGALNSGYVKRGNARLPRQGLRGPWKVVNNYVRDTVMLRHSSVEDGVLRFGSERARPRPGSRKRSVA